MELCQTKVNLHWVKNATSKKETAKAAGGAQKKGTGGPAKSRSQIQDHDDPATAKGGSRSDEVRKTLIAIASDSIELSSRLPGHHGSYAWWLV